MKAVSSHLVGVAVALGLLAPSPHILAADINYLPDDTVLVAAVNLKQIFDSEMLKRQPDAIGEMKEVLRHFAGIQTVQKYLRECGLDAFKHVKIITYVYTGSTSPKLSFVILDGTFDTATFADNSNGIRRRNSGKTPVYEITPRGEQTFHVVLVNATTIIAASDAASIDEALARSAGSKKSGLKKEMQSWLTSFDDRRSISFVSTGAAMAKLTQGVSIANIETAGSFLQTLSSFSGGLTLAKGIAFEVCLNAESEESAKKLTESAASGLRMLRTLAETSAEKDRKYLPLVDVVKKLEASQRGVRICIRCELSIDTVEKLISIFPVHPSQKGREAPAP